MMSDPADLVAEAVRTAFAGGFAADPQTISLDIDVQRVHVAQVDKLSKLTEWDAENPAAKAIKVYVLALPEEKRHQTRGGREVIYSVQVAIAAKPKTTDTTHIDPLKAMARELRDWFWQDGRKLPEREEAIEGIEVITTVDFGALKTPGLFLSEFVLQFAGMTP